MEEDKMTVRQFAEGLMAYLRGFTGGEVATGSAATVDFAVERAKLEAERTDRQVLDWKREGKLRATERAESLARTLLSSGPDSLVQFDGASVPLRMLFAQFVAENGPVVPMGELMVSDRGLGSRGAGERLVALAQEKSRREGLSYVQAFAAVSAADPEMARAAREE